MNFIDIFFYIIHNIALWTVYIYKLLFQTRIPGDT